MTDLIARLENAAQVESELRPQGSEYLSELLREAARALQGQTPPVCQWTADDEGNYHTGCDQDFCIIEGDPEANYMKFCCYCGQTLKYLPFVDEPDDDEAALPAPSKETL